MAFGRDINWHSVKDFLPWEVYGTYLVYFVSDEFPRGDCTWGHWDGNIWEVQESDEEFRDWSDIITHWAHLNRP